MIGAKAPSQAAKMFNNSLYSPNMGGERLELSSGSCIPKINGCLEHLKERPKLVIQPEWIVEDVSYYS